MLPQGRLIFWTFLCIVLLLSGVLGMLAMASSKENIRKDDSDVRKAMAVSVLETKYENVPVTIIGYGQVEALNQVTVSSENSGKVVYVNPKLRGW